MISKEKQAALEQYQKLTLATLEYLMEHYTGGIVYDGWDPMKNYYEDQEVKTNKYFTQRRLDRLKQQSDRLLKLGMRLDVNIMQFLQQKTGIELTVFDDMQEQVKNISQSGKIENQQEFNELSQSFHLLKQADKEIPDEAVVRSILQHYGVNQSKRERVDTVTTDLGNGKEIVSISFTSGPKPKHFEERESVSPSGNHKIVVTEWSDGRNANTHVDIVFKTDRGCVYGVTGICPDITAYWKDNNNIVIETKKSYTAFVKYKEVRSYKDVINIEYRGED